MSTNDFIAGLGSDARKMPVRVAFVTRRTSPHVRDTDAERELTHPSLFLRVGVAVEVFTVALVALALLWNAPLEELADPMHTPNPAKAPWYFLGLQELLHYFPPVVAGVLIPTLVIVALIVIPYFHVNIQADGLFVHARKRNIQIFAAITVVLAVFFAAFEVWVALLPTVIIAIAMTVAAVAVPAPQHAATRWLIAKPLSFWIMTWFLLELVTLTAVGTLFRGPGWSWVWPWR